MYALIILLTLIVIAARAHWKTLDLTLSFGVAHAQNQQMARDDRGFK